MIFNVNLIILYNAINFHNKEQRDWQIFYSRFGKNGTNLKLDDYFVEFDRLLNFTVTEQNKTIGRIGHYQVDGKLTAPAKGMYQVVELKSFYLFFNIYVNYKFSLIFKI